LLLNEAMSQLLIESCKLKVSPKGMDKDHQQTISTTFMITLFLWKFILNAT